MGLGNNPYRHAVHSWEQVRTKSQQEMVCSNFIIALPQCKIKVIQNNDPRGIVPHLRGQLVELCKWPEVFVEALADRQGEGLIRMGFEKRFKLVDMNWCDYFEKVRVRFKSSECHHVM